MSFQGEMELLWRTAGTVSIAILAALGVSAAMAAEPPNIDLHDLKLLDVRGQKHALDNTAHGLGTAFVFLSSECPISRQYIPELNRLAAGVDPEKIRFLGVLADRSVTRQSAVQFVDEFKIAFPVLFDASQELARQLRPDHVPEAFLVDADGKVVYSGRIDDLYADIDKRRSEPSSRDLRDAMNALSEGQTLAFRRAEPVGCPFETPAAGKSDDVTYSRDIAPILFAHCAECHRPGEVAPFSLLTYQDAAKRAEGISRVTGRRLMPPWRAEENHGHFLDERRLTPRQIELLATWAKLGAPEGNPDDLPPQPKFTSNWKLGEPDLIAQVPVPFTVPADGPDIFQHFVIPVEVARDEMIVGFEFRPGNPAVVHHAIVFLDARGRARERDAQTPEPGWRTSGSIDASITSMVGVWTPGMTPRFFPDDVGIPLDKGADVVVQLHLHPSGKEEVDQSRIGIYLAKKPVKKVMSRNPLLLGTLIIEIPPGESRYRTGSSVTLPTDLTLTSVFPHMHMIGKEMKVTATLPDGSAQPVIWIKDWNFYWQDSYVYARPLRLPKGTRLDVEAYYDNSAENPFNPSSPPKRVLFGNDSTDEMCFVLFQAVADDPAGARQLGGAVFRSMMQEWNTAPLSDDARQKILSEAMKLFGGGGRRQRPSPPAEEKRTDEKRTD